MRYLTIDGFVKSFEEEQLWQMLDDYDKWQLDPDGILGDFLLKKSTREYCCNNNISFRDLDFYMVSIAIQIYKYFAMKYKEALNMTLTHTDYDQMFGKNLTVYGESKMIQVERNYKLTLSEEQMRQLFNLLGRDKELLSINSGYDELRTVYNELKEIFNSGIRSTESFESAKDYNYPYTPGTK